MKFVHCPPRAARNEGQGMGADKARGHLALLRKVVPALSAGNASTSPEVYDKPARLTELLPPQVALADFSHRRGGFDPGAHPLDGPLDARRDNPVMRDLVRRVASDRTITDPPRQITGHIEEWFHGRAADGLDVIFANPPGTPDDLAEPVIPELRRRGLFRAHCTGHTPRDRRGLPRPSRRV
ncbi:hypothetical protein ABZY05_41845 [Streptomyces canus]|uniref:hypothetical protein n=1 Tax=Streptomyces canus TaxID=58343 RepID=UPI0033B7F0AC